MRPVLWSILAPLLGCAADDEPNVSGTSVATTDASDSPADAGGTGGEACGDSPETLASCIDADRYAADLEFIADIRPPDSEHWQRVQDLCVERLEAAGYDVETQGYETGVNVIGRRAGVTTPAEVVLVSAHYDHIPECPGADDNATGVAAALEIGRVLALAELPRTVMIACWDEEETNLRGSTAWANQAAEDGLDVVMNFNFDMIGFASDEPNSQIIPTGLDALFPDAAAEIAANEYRGDFIMVVANAAAQLATTDFIDQAQRVALPTTLLEVPEGMELSEAYSDTRRSDHASMWAVGYPALLLTDTAEPRNRNYHCRGGPDVVEDLDEEFALAVARATVAATAIVAGL